MPFRRPVDDESALIAAALAGDGDAYARLIRPYEGVAYRVAAAVAGSAADGEEAVQNAYVKAHRSLGRFRRGAPFQPWLLRIVVNEARNVRRSELRHVRLAARATELHDPAFVAGEDREDVTEVLAGLRRLSQQDRVALALRTSPSSGTGCGRRRRRERRRVPRSRHAGAAETARRARGAR